MLPTDTKIGTIAAPMQDPIVVARDATYAPRGYRSFEFVTFSAYPGEVTALLASEHTASRDLALACAGIVRPTEGSLAVDGVELAARAGKRPRAVRLEPGVAGVGVFSALFETDAQLSVEEVVSREFALREADDRDILEYLAEFSLATQVDQNIFQLPPAARALLSCALACVGKVKVAIVDLDDAIMDGLSAEGAVRVVRTLSAFCARHGVCALVATQEAAAARAADRAVALDIASAEGLLSADGSTKGGDAR